MLNQVTLIGRLVKKPELKESEKGVSYVRATIAVQSTHKDREGEYKVEFLEFTAFGKTAENTAKYCDKGSLINIEGSLSNNVYTDKNGKNHYHIVIIANRINFLSRLDKKELKKDDVFVLGQ